MSFRTVPEHTTHQCTIHYMPLGRQFGVGYIDSLPVSWHLGRHLLCAICLHCSRPRRTCGEKSLSLLQLSRGLDWLNRLSPGLQEKIVADDVTKSMGNSTRYCNIVIDGDWTSKQIWIYSTIEQSSKHCDSRGGAKTREIRVGSRRPKPNSFFNSHTNIAPFTIAICLANWTP